MIIETPRLKLIATTLAHIETELNAPTALSAMLDAEVPASWPPGEYDRSAMEFFRECLSVGEHVVGWYGWYAIEKSSNTLVGGGGYFGPPDETGTVAIGYSVTPEFRARGYATEMVDSLVHRLIDHCDVKQVMAETNETNLGSIKVLERNGFFLLRERGEEPNTLKFQRNLVSV